MKRLSRLTALLLALMLLVCSAAQAEVGIQKEDLDLAGYNSLLAGVQTYGLADGGYEYYIRQLSAQDVDARYETLSRWHASWLGTVFYADFIGYYKANYPGDDLLCTCAAPAPYNTLDHASDCAWNNGRVNGFKTVENIIEGVKVAVTGVIPEDAVLQLIPSVSVYSVDDMFSTDQQILFSADIAVLNADGTKWQPAYGEKATIEMDAVSIGLTDGDEFFVLHHLSDGSMECIEDVQVNNGIVSFTTSSFSGFDVITGSTATIKNVSNYFDVTGQSGNNHYNVKGIYFDNDGVAYMLLEGKSGNSPSKSLTSITLSYIANNILVKKTISSPAYTAAAGINRIELVDNNGNLVDTIVGDSKTWYWSISLGNDIEVTDIFTLTVDFAENGFDIDGEEYTVTLNYDIIKNVYSVAGKEPVWDTGSAITDYDVEGNPVFSEVRTAVVEPGEAVVYEVTINNGSDSNINLAKAVISDILPKLPSGFSFTSVKCGESLDSITNVEVINGTIIMDRDLELVPGASKTYYVQVVYPTGLASTVEQVFTNTASISGENLVTRSDSAYVEIPPLKKGSLTITKSGLNQHTYAETSEYSDYESAIFTVSGDGKIWTVVLCKENGYSVTLTDLMTGTYTVAEQTGWTWRYMGEADKYVVVPGGGSASVEFTNQHNNQKWLGGDNYATNVFGTSN